MPPESPDPTHSRRAEIELAIGEAERLRDLCPHLYATLTVEIDAYRHQQAELLRPSLFRTTSDVRP